MRNRAGWGVVAAVMAAAVGVGCGRDGGGESLQVPVPVDGPETQVPADNPVPVPVPDTEGEAPPAPDVPEKGWWQVTPEASPITFEVPACIQVDAGTTPRFSHPCSVKQFWDHGALAILRRYDAEGHLVEDTFFPWNGTPASSTLSTYVRGLKVRQEIRNGWGSRRITEWIHDDAGRLVHERFLHGEGSREPQGLNGSRYFYDAQGRRELVRHYMLGPDGTEELSFQYRYAYGEAGRLEAIQYSEFDVWWVTEESFTYHPNGQLQRHSTRRYTPPSPSGTREDYDEQGRLLYSEVEFDQNGTRTTYAYDARGRREEEHLVHRSGSGHRDRFTRFLYDDSGRIGAERVIEDEDSPFASAPYAVRKREVKRYFYSCGGDLLFEEQDTNEDGVRDGWHELVRDAAGNLRAERFLGTRVVRWAPISRIEYDYSCHE